MWCSLCRLFWPVSTFGFSSTIDSSVWSFLTLFLPANFIALCNREKRHKLINQLSSDSTLFAMLMADRRAQAAARGTTRSSSDSCFQHVNSIWFLLLRLFLSFFAEMVNENMVKSEIKYVFKDTALKLNVKSRKYADINNDSKEIVS